MRNLSKHKIIVFSCHPKPSREDKMKPTVRCTPESDPFLQRIKIMCQPAAKPHYVHACKHLESVRQPRRSPRPLFSSPPPPLLTDQCGAHTLMLSDFGITDSLGFWTSRWRDEADLIHLIWKMSPVPPRHPSDS